MSVKYRDFQPVKSSPTRHTIGGKVAFEAPRGLVVLPKSDGTDELVKANGKAGYFLMRGVVTAAALTAAIKANEVPTGMASPAEFEYPYEVNASGQAEDLQEFWVEGDDLIHDLDENTTVGTKVTTNAGKIAELTDSATQECLGIVRAIEDAKNTEDAKRFRIEVIRGTVDGPVA